VRRMVTQKGAPTLTGRISLPGHVLVYGPAVRCKPDVMIWR
jgi:hypothetical protein